VLVHASRWSARRKWRPGGNDAVRADQEGPGSRGSVDSRVGGASRRAPPCAEAALLSPLAPAEAGTIRHGPAALFAGRPCMGVGGAPRGRERAARCTHASLGGQPHKASKRARARISRRPRQREVSTTDACAMRSSRKRRRASPRQHRVPGRHPSVRSARTVHRISSSSKSGAAGGDDR
jgi:hypothetical protein